MVNQDSVGLDNIFRLQGFLLIVDIPKQLQLHGGKSD